MQPLRLFIALSLPADVQKQLQRIFSSLLAPQQAVRPIKPPDLHLTVKFLGATPLEMLQPITSALEELSSSLTRPIMHITHGLTLPPHRPRTIVIGIEANPQLQKIFDLIDKELAARDLANQETRLFQPHITVARVKGAFDQRLAERIESWRPEMQDFEAEALTLFESKLDPSGAHYTPLVSYNLQ